MKFATCRSIPIDEIPKSGTIRSKGMKGDRKEPGTEVRPSKAVQTDNPQLQRLGEGGRNPEHKASCPLGCLPYHHHPEPAR